MIIGKGRLGVLKNLFILIKFNLPIPLIGKGIIIPNGFR